MEAAGLYISVPFCRSKCTFCNFASGVFPASYMERYIGRVCKDLQTAREWTDGSAPAALDSIYLGGGTPSLLPPDLLKRLFTAIRELHQIAGDAEITVECAPGQIADDTLAAMVECGVNRISFGVQSFVDREAQATGRLHTRAIALEDIGRVRRAGIKRVNADLIAGLPHQTAHSWRESLSVLCDTEVDHTSIYMLEVDDDSRLGKEILNGGARYFAPSIPSDDAVADMYVAAIEALTRSGLAQYEISNFTRDGAVSGHNMKYWRRRPYLGVGVDAHSMLRAGDGATIRFASTADLDSYLAAAGWDERQRLTREEELEEAWFLGLRLNAGIDVDALKAEFGAGAVEEYCEIISELIDGNLLARNGSRIALTLRGKLLSNDVFAQFLKDEETAAVSELS